jgi:hypothetical protein
MNNAAKSILEERDIETDQEAWDLKTNSNQEAKRALEGWNNNNPLPDFTNAIAKKWADFEKKKADGTLGKLEEETERKTLLREVYNGQLNEDEKDLYALSEEDLIDAYDRGVITDQNIDNALAVEKQLYDAGLISKESLARKLNMSARGYKGRKSGKNAFTIPSGFSLLPSGGASSAGSLQKLLLSSRVDYKG